MAEETLQWVESMVDGRPTVDNRAVYERLWAVFGELFEKVSARFELTPDPSCEPFASFGGGDGAPRGSLRAYAGPEIDWLVHSWIGQPEQSFSNMHLTAWLGPQTRVPHLGMACGTIPNVWFYFDYVPRAELTIDVEHLQRYFDPLNEDWLAFRASTDMEVFTSRSLFIRESLTDTAYCYSGEPSDEHVELITGLAHRHVDRWLGWLEDPEAVDPADRPALAARDIAFRRNVAELDPANVMGVRYFGEEMTAKLVRMLWGGDRSLPRAGSS